MRRAFACGPLLALLALLALVACGGGGGGGGTAPPPGGGGGGTVTASGRLWHDFYALDSVTGLQLSPLDGSRSTRLDALEAGAPTPDGTHFVVAEYDLVNDTSTLSLKATATGAVLGSAVLDGYVTRLRPSPRQLGELLVDWASTAISGDAVTTAIDLPGRRILQAYTGAVAGDWLADGRVLTLAADGGLAAGMPGGTATALGRLAVTGWLPRAVWADPTARPSPSTATRPTSAPAPACVITGSCELFWAPATARELTPSQAAISAFTVTDAGGARETLGCELLGWTR